MKNFDKRFGGELSVDETGDVLAAIGSRIDVQLGRPGRLLGRQRPLRLDRLFAALRRRRLLDNRLRHHLRPPGPKLFFFFFQFHSIGNLN